MGDKRKPSPAAVKAMLTGGMEGWGQWGSALEHVRYIEPIDDHRSRRRCHCGCKRRATHRGMANGICLATGCELSMLRWQRSFADYLRSIRATRPPVLPTVPLATPTPSEQEHTL